MPALTSLLALITLDALVQVNDQHFCSLNDAIANQCTQPGTSFWNCLLLLRVCAQKVYGADESLGHVRHCLVFLDAHRKTLVDFRVARQDGLHVLAGNFRDMHTVDRGNAHCSSIAKHIESTGEVVAALSIGDNALIALVLSRSRLCPASYFHKSLQNHMHRLTSRLPALTFCEEQCIPVISFHLHFAGNPVNVCTGYPLKQCQALQDGLDRTHCIEPLEIAAYRWSNIHHLLYHLLGHF